MSVTGPALTASFVYDGDGRRVKSTINGVLTTFVGAHYEITGTTATKYYFAGTQRVAIRAGTTLSYLLSDHLGSTSITTNSSGALVSELRYKPWGEVRYSSGTTSTKYTFTSQYSYQLDFGLLFYNARMYDPLLGRFTSADTVVPGGVQGLDRYAYVNNSPLVYTDPSGHESVCGHANSDTECSSSDTWSLPFIDSQYSITFVNNWATRNKGIARTAVSDVAGALLGAYKQSCGWSESCIAYSAAEIFSAVYNTSAQNPLILQWGCSECNGGGGYTYSSHKIGFASLSEPTIAGGGYRTNAMAFREAVNNVVHELGHAFGARASSSPYNYIQGDLNSDIGFYPNPIGASLTWRQHPCSWDTPCSSSEVFADMFLGWTYGMWDDDEARIGTKREHFMSSHMAPWIVNLVSP